MAHDRGSTGRLIQLCIGYFVFYVITGITVKYFLGSVEDGLPGMKGVEFLVYSTLGGTSVALSVVLVLRWFRMKSLRMITWGKLTFPSEYLYIIPSGICTAVVIPTTTLMYTLPISVMVAMVIMRGSVIVISRVVDSIQTRQGLLDKKVYLEENVAVSLRWPRWRVHVFFSGPGGFEFLQSRPAMMILGAYIGAYSFRIYIMNYYKLTRGKGKPSWITRPFYAATSSYRRLPPPCWWWRILVFNAPRPWFGWPRRRRHRTCTAERFNEPRPRMESLSHSGRYGFRGGVLLFRIPVHVQGAHRHLCRAGQPPHLAHRRYRGHPHLSLRLGGRFPALRDWLSLGFILVAIAFLTRAERRRAAELKATHEIEELPAAAGTGK